MQNSGHCDKAGAGGYNETTFVQTMDALKTTGLDKLGYIYLVRHTPTKGFPCSSCSGVLCAL
jgi:hypothetical protein